MGSSMYLLIPLLTVGIYRIALFLGINTTLLTISYFVPAIFGAATVFVMYKLGTILHSKRTGLFTAILTALGQGFISRTIVGFFDNECMGIFFLFLTFYFFIKGYTTDNMVHNVLAGLSLGALSLTWGAFRYGYAILAVYALLMILMRKYSRRLLSSYSMTILIAMMIAVLIPRNGAKFIFQAEIIIPLMLIVLMLGISFYQELQKNIDAEKLQKGTRIAVLSLVGVTIVAVVVLYALGIIAPIASKFVRTIFPTIAESIPLIDSVAENVTSTWGQLFYNIYIMVFLVPLGFYFCIKKPNEKTIFILILGLTGLYFGVSMVRLSLIMTPAAAVVAGYTFDEVLRPFALIFQERFTISQRKRRATKQIGRDLITVAYIFMAVVLLFTAIYGVNMTDLSYGRQHELVPVYSQGGQRVLGHDYQETFSYIRNNIAPYELGEKPPVVMSWWDYGYQLHVLGNVTTLADNATINSTQIGVVGTMLIGNESYSAKLCKKYDVDYVLVYSMGLPGKSKNDIAISTWMMKISERYTPELGIKYEDYYDETKLPEDGGGFQDPFWQSTVFKLVAYKLNSNGYYGGQQNNAAVAKWRSGEYANAPDVNSLSHFRLVFQSKQCICRVYEVL
jgi:dolichyl-diphosphooligosaccharide--protein glycosyltransferase